MSQQSDDGAKYLPSQAEIAAATAKLKEEHLREKRGNQTSKFSKSPNHKTPPDQRGGASYKARYRE